MRRILPFLLLLSAVSSALAAKPNVSNGSATGQVGVAFSFQISATNSPTGYGVSGLPAGLGVNTATGLISGTPAVGTDAGSPYSLTITATNGSGTGTGTLTLTIKPAAPVITSVTTVGGTVCNAFSYQITATNSPASYNATPLPAGLAVNTSTGLISGTPTASGTFTVTISATNAGGTGSATLTITINPPATPVITSATTATGTIGTVFSYQIVATNCPTSYNAIGLPPGLSINTSTGVISGTPTIAGTYSVTISATNTGGTGTATLTITINPPPPVITSPTTAIGNVSSPFNYQITATNNPTSFGVTGTLPPGLTLNAATGLISGTPTTAGTYMVTISASNAGGTGSASLTITIKVAVPIITSSTIASGNTCTPFSYTVTASNSPTSYNANPLPAGLSVNTSTGLISGTPTATGTFTVTISATNAGGTGSATLTITISSPPAPVITSATTATGTVSVAFSYQIVATNCPTSYNATGGVPAGLSVNTSTGVISGTPTTAGTYSVTLSATNSGGSGNVTLTLTINNPVPTTISLSPNSATAGSAQFTLTVTGTKFVSTSTVYWNGSPLVTTFVSATQLTAIVPGANVAAAGTASVTVVNPAPGGGTSNAQTFTINNPGPTITSINPTCATAGGPQFTLTVTGTNFVSTSMVRWGATSLTTTFVSSTQVTATVPAALIATAGTASITVVNPAPGGGTSNAQTFTIRAVPTISSLGPTCATAGGGQFTLTVNGTNFISGSTVNWNGSALTTSFVSATQLTAIVPAGLIATAGMASITVLTPCGGTSNAQTFTIAATPVITSPLTACGTVGSAFSYTITATNNPTSFTASPLPAGLSVNTSTGVISGTPTQARTSSVTITASNAAGTCNTATATLMITIGTTPTISSISPTCIGSGGPDFTLTVNGPNNDFIQGDTVYWDETALATTFVSSKQLKATVPAALIATPGTPSITVRGCGATSGAAPFTISAVPTISSLTPTCANVGDPQFTLTVNGTNFVSTSIVNWNGAALATTFASSTLLTATVPATRIANAGTASIAVTSPCGGTSNAMTFPIDDAASITSSVTVSATVGTPFSYQITADNSPTSFDATDLPGGLTLGPIPGLISGTPTAAGVFPITLSATNVTNDPCSGIATATLTLTVTFPSGVFIPSFPGQPNVFDTGLPSSGPTPSGTIPFPNQTTNNYFELYWNYPESTNQNPHIIDLARGGLQRTADTVGMQYNPYTPPARPDGTKNIWRGNPTPPNDPANLGLGQFGDPRASWYITDPWPTADYATSSYWGGPHPNMNPLNWPDSGHAFSYTGIRPADKGAVLNVDPKGVYPTPDIMASPTPTPDPTKSISLLPTSTSGNLASVTDLGNVWDPAQLSFSVTNPGGALPDIPSLATLSSIGGGGHTLAIGRPEFSAFDQNGRRAWQLLDIFSANGGTNTTTNTAGRVNLNTASRDVLRSLAAGILQNRDTAIQPNSLQNNLYPPTVSAQADKFADAVINSRPLLSTSALSAIRDAQGQPFFGNPNQYNGSTQTPPTEWNDPGREELFAKIYNLATTRSRNFRVFVTGQSLDKNGNVLSTVTKVYQVFVKPNRDPNTGAIQSQQVEIKYEGSM